MSLKSTMVLLVAGFLAACNGTDDADPPAQPPPPPPAPETAPTGDTRYVPEWVVVFAEFGYDLTTNSAVPYTTTITGAPETAPIGITVFLADASFATSGALNSSNSCYVTMSTLTPAPHAAWAPTYSAWAGFDLPVDFTTTTDCDGIEFPGSWGADPVSHVTKWQWGFGIGDLDPDVASQLEAALSPSDWAANEPFLIGGSLYTDVLFNTNLAPEGFYDDAIAQAFEADTTNGLEIILDGVGNPIPVDKSMIQVTAPSDQDLDGIPDLPGEVLPAVYYVETAFGPADQLLLRDPYTTF